MLLLTSLTASCATGGYKPGCQTYAEQKRGLIGADAPATPDGVKRRVLEMDNAMTASCR